MTFSRSDMHFVHYRWEGDEMHDEARFKGSPSRRSFDPYNGNQVLYLINCCASAVEKFGIKEARNMEKSIAYHLPERLKSERSVYDWLMETVAIAD